jgi:hypothetical protein
LCTGKLTGCLTVVYMQLRAARVATLLWEKRYASLGQLACALPPEPSSSTYTEIFSKKHRMGKNMLQDYETINIGQSTYFTGAQFDILQYEAILFCSCFTTWHFANS